MATVRKAKYIYKDGTYFEVGGDGVDQAARDAAATAQATADSKAAIDDTAPSATSVYSSDKVEQEITAAVADFVSFTEDQTSRTGAEKAQARSNIKASESWTLLWQNASPSSNFAAQTIPLTQSANNFDALAVQLAVNGGIVHVNKNDYSAFTLFAPGYIAANGTTAFRMRDCSANGSSLTFGDNVQVTINPSPVSVSRGVRNDLNQPLKIWGVNF